MPVRRFARAQANLEQPAVLFAVLRAPARLELVARLATDGAQSITRLTEGRNPTRQAVSKPLRVLAAAGLVHSAASGREHRWAAEPRRLDIARCFLDTKAQQWDDRLSALQRHLQDRGG